MPLPSSAALRIGILGAARIAPNALCRPAAGHPRAEVVAVAARDRHRAERFATRWSIPTVHDSYAELLADPAVDAVYNPLPNGLHGRWTLAAIAAGKHVLCEKPFTANEDEARTVAAAAAAGGTVVMEAFHWRHHPMAAEVLRLVADGAIGQVRSAAAAFCFPLTARDDIRWDLDLAGGALMDAGCYPVHMLRTFLGQEPEIWRATAALHSPGVDRRVDATLGFPGGVTAELVASMWSSRVVDLRVRLDGDDGRLTVLNPLVPQYGGAIVLRSGRRRSVRLADRTTTYRHQLDAFVDAALDGAPVVCGPADAVANMAAIDALYRAAGLEPRRPTP